MRLALCIINCLYFVTACEPRGGSQPPASTTRQPQFEERLLSLEEVQQHKEQEDKRRKNVENCTRSNRIIYFRDPRAPSLCFAWMWQNDRIYLNSATGGPGLTWVPCAANPNPHTRKYGWQFFLVADNLIGARVDTTCTYL